MWDAIRVKRLRTALGFTQGQLAHAIGYRNKVTVCLWESGKRKIYGPALLQLERLEQQARRKGRIEVKARTKAVEPAAEEVPPVETATQVD